MGKSSSKGRNKRLGPQNPAKRRPGPVEPHEYPEIPEDLVVDEDTRAAYAALARLGRAQAGYRWTGEYGHEVEVGLDELNAAFAAYDAVFERTGATRGDAMDLRLHLLGRPCPKGRRFLTRAELAAAATPQQRAAAHQNWAAAAADQPCRCGRADCGHGQPCPGQTDSADPCSGVALHLRRTPCADDVTAWRDSFECTDGCDYDARVDLPATPWGTVDCDGNPTVFEGVDHPELGAYA